MLLKPIFRKSECREKPLPPHLIASYDEEWFSNEMLKEHGLSAISFDFFVNWKNKTLSDEYWVKRIVSETRISSPSNEVIQELIYECDSEEFVKDLAAFATSNNASLKYKLFRESTKWENLEYKDYPIMTVDIDQSGEVNKVWRNNLSSLIEQIKKLSGGPVCIGEKGLTYSYSNLEYYLSKTDSVWPGDVDLILLDEEKKPVAILEFKKHTLTDKIENHKFERYYIKKWSDRRKYDRLAILRDEIGEGVPLLVLYYPTREIYKKIIIEEVLGEVGNLHAGENWDTDVPSDEQGHQNLIKKIIEIIKR